MLEIDRKMFIFKTKEVHFSDYPFDIEDCDDLEFLYCKNKVDVNGFARRKDLTMIIDLTKDLDTLQRGLNKGTRYAINRAERDGIKIRKSDKYDQFYQIYRSLLQKKGMTSVFKVFGLGIIPLEEMKNYGTLFVAEYDGEVLCGDVYLESPQTVFVWAGASKRLEVDRAKANFISKATRLCQWEAIKYYKEQSKKELDMGGMWSEKEAEQDRVKKGINYYKSAFGGEVVTRYSYRKTYTKTLNFARYLYNLKKFIYMERK